MGMAWHGAGMGHRPGPEHRAQRNISLAPAAVHDSNNRRLCIALCLRVCSSQVLVLCARFSRDSSPCCRCCCSSSSLPHPHPHDHPRPLTLLHAHPHAKSFAPAVFQAFFQRSHQHPSFPGSRSLAPSRTPPLPAVAGSGHRVWAACAGSLSNDLSLYSLSTLLELASSRYTPHHTPLLLMPLLTGCHYAGSDCRYADERCVRGSKEELLLESLSTIPMPDNCLLASRRLGAPDDGRPRIVSIVHLYSRPSPRTCLDHGRPVCFVTANSYTLGAYTAVCHCIPVVDLTAR